MRAMTRYTIAIAALATLGACSRSKASDVADAAAAPPIDIAAADLAKNYKTNRERADADYKGKRVRVSGVVGDVRKDDRGAVSITLGREGDAESVADCFFADDFNKQAASLGKGVRLTIECDCEGLDGNVILRKCGFGTPATAASASAPRDGKGAMDVCKKLEAAGVAAKCRAGEGAGERARFDIASLPGKSGMVVRLADDALYGKYVAGLVAQPEGSPLKPYYGAPRLRIVVHLTPGVTKETEDQMKAALDAF
jgi:hypothetical protein